MANESNKRKRDDAKLSSEPTFTTRLHKKFDIYPSELRYRIEIMHKQMPTNEEADIKVVLHQPLYMVFQTDVMEDSRYHGPDRKLLSAHASLTSANVTALEKFMSNSDLFYDGGRETKNMPIFEGKNRYYGSLYQHVNPAFHEAQTPGEDTVAWGFDRNRGLSLSCGRRVTMNKEESKTGRPYKNFRFGIYVQRVELSI